MSFFICSLYREKYNFLNSCASYRPTIINQYLSVIKEKNISDIKHIPVSSFQRIIINNSKEKYMPKCIKIPEGLSKVKSKPYPSFCGLCFSLSQGKLTEVLFGCFGCSGCTFRSCALIWGSSDQGGHLGCFSGNPCRSKE